MRHEADLAEISGITVIILTLALVTSLTIRGRQKVPQPSDAVTTFWLLFSVSRGAAFYSDFANVQGESDAAADSGLLNVRALCDAALFALGLIQLILSSLPVKPWPYLRLQAETFQCVLREWPLLPRTFFAYTWRVVVLGFRNKLELPSLNALCTGLKAFTVSTAFHLATTKKDRLR
ncbi:multidrug resistance-associated protein 1 [Ixodes scapularis]